MQMGIEQNQGGRKGKGSSESRKSNRRQKKPSPVQRLYDTCKEVFADCGPGVVPSPEKVERLAAVLDGITPADVGLRPNQPYFSSERAPIISYLPLHAGDNFSIGIFCLPPVSVIPLHNHPAMTVFSKLLFGTMHIKAYDWSNEADGNAIVVQPNGSRLAKLKINSTFTAPCSTSILYPADGGNMHCFTAGTACAVLDVLGPPYSDDDGRHCQYYYELPLATSRGELEEEERERYAWLKEREKPRDLCILGVPYDGPKILKK
ncbi:plant cysteine oxidase 2-like [Andrographis paniculata]|uniref:plant cysteine oxidase 2-like n=1 Tax=Andrographis paniculata TaxID=175694 RepID=UPI0021E75402|nr:plant cysteine oxidase 2-like [Andrographis paniculata]